MQASLIIALFIGLTTYAIASDVLVLTDSDFETKIKQYDVALAEFYAPWCGHCMFSLLVSRRITQVLLK